MHNPVPSALLNSPAEAALFAQIFSRRLALGIYHEYLSDLLGGSVGEHYHLTSARYTTLTGIQTANTVFAGPVSNGAAIAAFRALVTADLPAGTGTVTSVTATSPLASSGGATPDISLNANSITLDYLSGDIFAFAAAQG